MGARKTPCLVRKISHRMREKFPAEATPSEFKHALLKFTLIDKFKKLAQSA